MKRILAFTLIFVMLFTSMLAVMPAAEKSATPALEITKANVEFGTTVFLLIQVNYAVAGLESGDGVTVDVTNKADETVTLSPDSTIKDVDEGCVAFKYTALSAKEMGDDLTITAKCDGVESDTVTYSVLEYAIKAKATATDSAKDQALVELVEAMIDFGAAAQKAFNYTPDRVLKADNGTSFGYGIVLCKGAKSVTSTDATISSVAPLASGYNTLRDIAFNKITDSDKVSEGINRYFYYGIDENVYSKHTNGNPLFCLKPGTVLPDGWKNMTVDAFIEAMADYIIEGPQAIVFDDDWTGVHSSISVATASRFGLGATGTSYSRDNAASNIFYTGITVTGIPIVVNVGKAYNRDAVAPWALRPVAENIGNHKFTSANNYLCVETPEGQPNAAVYIYNDTATANNYLTDGKMTISVSLALDADNTNTSAIVAGFSESYHFSGKKQAELFRITPAGVLTIGNKNVTSISKVSVNDHANLEEPLEFTTIHFVIDENAKTITAYSEDGNRVETALSFASGATAMSEVPNFSLITRGDVYINRISMAKGDVFN